MMMGDGGGGITPKMTVAKPPPLAIVLIVDPSTGSIQIQWPPNIPLQAVRDVVAGSLMTLENMIRAQVGGIVLPGGPIG